jgi:putative membrane protein
MKGLFLRWLVITSGIILSSYIFKGIKLEGYLPAFGAAAVLGILNATIRPILLILTLPLNILTLGLFTFLLNGLLLWFVSSIISGFNITGIIPSIGGAILIWCVSLFASTFIK